MPKSKSKVVTAPTSAGLIKRHTKAVGDLFNGWLDMAEAALSEPSISPNAPHVRLAIAASAGIPVVCWLQADNTVGWKIAMPVHIKKADDGETWDVLFIDPAMAAEEEAKVKAQQGSGMTATQANDAGIKIDLSATAGGAR